jgi:hypothetical protein
VGAFNDMSKAERDMLCARFADPLFMRFFDFQEQAAREQMAMLDPDDKEMTADEFRQRAREFRAVWQFWNEFRELANEWAARSNKQR